MDDDAWAGWAVLKLLSEAVARAQSTEPARILAYLRHEMAFDGQKACRRRFATQANCVSPCCSWKQGNWLAKRQCLGLSTVMTWTALV